MREAYGQRPSVIRGNVRLIQRVFEAWRGHFTPPRRVVVDFLDTGTRRSNVAVCFLMCFDSRALVFFKKTTHSQFIPNIGT
jgi:hypothetical protein